MKLELIGFTLAFSVGLVMGLIGAGGSILSSGLMIYIFGFSPVLSASYTLLNVGIISLIGTIQYYRKDLVDFTTGFLFSLPAIATVLCMRTFILPAIPAVLLEYHGLIVSKELCMIIVFALLMIVIAWNMIHNTNNRNKRRMETVSKPVVFVTAVIVGVLTGVVGIGGGFLIVPALFFFNGLDMKTAVGTSLFIITLNTGVGFASDFSSGIIYNWMFLSKLIVVTVAGMLISGTLVEKINTDRLKKFFAVVMLIVGCWILLKELVLAQKMIVDDRNVPVSKCSCQAEITMPSIFFSILE